MEDKLESLINKSEIRRLEKAARDKDKRKLVDWAKQFEEQMRVEYEKAYQDELGSAIDIFTLTIVYTLHFNQKTRFGGKRIDDFMKDLYETVDMFRRGEAVPDDYRKELEDDKIYVLKRGGD